MKRRRKTKKTLVKKPKPQTRKHPSVQVEVAEGSRFLFENGKLIGVQAAD